MSVIALNNRVKSDSDAVFASCAALPVQQTTLNVDEMAGIDGLWDWGEFAESVVVGTIATAAGGAAGGAVVGAMAGGVGAAPAAAAGAISGAVAGAVGGAVYYTASEIISEIWG